MTKVCWCWIGVSAGMLLALHNNVQSVLSNNMHIITIVHFPVRKTQHRNRPSRLLVHNAKTHNPNTPNHFLKRSEDSQFGNKSSEVFTKDFYHIFNSRLRHKYSRIHRSIEAKFLRGEHSNEICAK